MSDEGNSMDVCEEVKTQFFLSRVIHAHEADVRAVHTTPTGIIASGSRDGSAKLFTQRCGDYVESSLMGFPSRVSINTVVVYEKSPGEWVLFAGAKDGAIAIFTPDFPEPVHLLREHKLNVCALYLDSATNVLMSGSWDNMAIVWPLKEIVDGQPYQALMLSGHKMSVWAVVSVPGRPGFYLTGSADMTIKFWKDDKEVNSFSGHEDVVRSLVVISPSRFLSASNDSMIRLWDLDAGVCLQKYSSLTGEYIFSMAEVRLSSTVRMLVNVGEGGCVEFWQVDGEGCLAHKQVIRTPMQSLWSVATLEIGDVVVGTDDGSIYVFTASEERKASSGDVELFESKVARKVAADEEIKAAQQQEVVKIKVSLDDGQPNMELRYKKGTNPADAAETFIRENDLPITYLDEIVEYMKANIPEARQASNLMTSVQRPSKKVIVDGKEWDYVFDVSTEDGRVLKLPYNVGEDTGWAAQRFVERNNLPIQFLQKVSALLRAQIPGAMESFGSFEDPFTGGGRYVPGAGAAGGGLTSSDPFTGGGRYVPGTGSNASAGSSSGFVDPLTGHGAYVAGSSKSPYMPNASVAQDKKRPRGELVPLRDYFKFGIEQTSAKAFAKLKELNDAQTEENRLNDEQMKSMESLMTKGSFEVKDVHVSALDAGLTWPIGSILPILDCFRLALLNRQLNRIYCSMRDEMGRSPRGENTLQLLNAFLLSAESDPIRILSCRAFANCAVHQWGREMLMHDITANISAVVAQMSSSKPALQLAAASALANWALLLLQQTESGGVAELGPREDALRAIIQGLENNPISSCSDSAYVRLLQAIVTLMWGDTTVIKLAKSRGICAIVERIKDAMVDESGKAVARDIVEMTYAV